GRTTDEDGGGRLVDRSSVVRPLLSQSHASRPGTVPERSAVRTAAVPACGWAHARVRDHGPCEPGTWLALHGGRLFRRHLHGVDRQLHRGRGAGARRRAHRRHGGRSDRHAKALWPRPPRPGARHIWPDPVLQRAGADRLGPGRIEPAIAGVAEHLDRDPAGSRLSDLSHRHHRDCACSRAAALSPGHAHAAPYADPGGRLQPRDDRRARRQHQPALYARVRPRRRACCPRRPDAGADPDRADRHGREHSVPRVRGDHHRWHRLDPRRFHCRDHGRADRHPRPRLPARSPGTDPGIPPIVAGCAGAVLDADLSLDDDRARGASGGLVPGIDQMTGWFTLRNIVVAGLLIVLALVPVYVSIGGNTFLMTLFTRIVILAMAATSLNLILG